MRKRISSHPHFILSVVAYAILCSILALVNAFLFVLTFLFLHFQIFNELFFCIMRQDFREFLPTTNHSPSHIWSKSGTTHDWVRIRNNSWLLTFTSAQFLRTQKLTFIDLSFTDNSKKAAPHMKFYQNQFSMRKASHIIWLACVFYILVVS